MATDKGRFYLMGAGPGDPALLTLKAAEVLAGADAVVLDAALDAEGFLARCRAGVAHCIVAHAPVKDTQLPPAVARGWALDQVRSGKTVCLLVEGNPQPAGPWTSWLMAVQDAGAGWAVIPGVDGVPFDAADTLPLLGKTILITRARVQAGTLQQQLEGLGARVLSFPTIEIVPPEYPEVIAQALREIPTYDWVVFTSKNGVEQAMQLLFLEGLDARLFAGVQIAAVGPATAEALGCYGLFSDLMPRQFVAEALFEAFQEAGVGLAGKRFLLLQGSIASNQLLQALRGAGADVDPLTVYRTVDAPPSPETAGLVNALLAREVDMITFSSSSAVQHLAKRLTPVLAHEPRLLDGVLLAAIGPVTGQTVEDCFGRIDLEAPVHTVPGLVAAIAAYYTGNKELTRTP